jgi:hypothetical protein
MPVKRYPPRFNSPKFQALSDKVGGPLSQAAQKALTKPEVIKPKKQEGPVEFDAAESAVVKDAMKRKL